MGTHLWESYLTWEPIYEGVRKYAYVDMHVETQIWNQVYSLINSHLIYWCRVIQLNLKLTNKASLASPFAQGAFQLSFPSTGLTDAPPCLSSIPMGSEVPILPSHCWEYLKCRATSSSLGNVLRLQYSHSFYLKEWSNKTLHNNLHIVYIGHCFTYKIHNFSSWLISSLALVHNEKSHICRQGTVLIN